MYDFSSDVLLQDVPTIEGFKVLEPAVIYDRIGSGGFGTVYLGRHLTLGIDVAVKCLRVNRRGLHEQSVLRFKREAQLAARLSDANLVRVFTIQEHGSVHYLVMEYVEGETAHQRTRRKGYLSVNESLTIVLGAASGLATAHRNNVIHRDIKPANLLISTAGDVKVTDLGLAKPQEEDAGMTQEQTIMGSPGFMSPEQCRSFHTVDKRADVYALGATLYFLLTGEAPLAGSTAQETLLRTCTEPFPNINDERPDVPGSLEQVLSKCVDKEPSERYDDAEAVREALHSCISESLHTCDLRASDTTKLELRTSSAPSSQIVDSIRFAVSEPPTLETPTLETPTEPQQAPSAALGPSWAKIGAVVILLAVGVLGLVKMILDRTDEASPPARSTWLQQAESERKAGRLRKAYIYAHESSKTEASPEANALLDELRAEIESKLESGLRIDAPRDQQKSGANLQVVGHVEYEGQIYWIRVNGAQVRLDAGNFSRDLSNLPDGRQEIEVEVRVEGMDGPTIRRKRSVTIDRKAPSLSVNNEPGSPRQSPYTLSGTAFDATQVEINGEAVVVRDGGWSKAFKLNDGEHTFKITAEDDVGNRTTLDPVIVQIDTKKPTINFVAPNATERWVTNQASVLVEVKVEDESGFESIRIGGSEIPERNADGLYSRTVPLTKVDQSIEIDIVAVDQAKNKAMASLRVIRDVDRPELHIKSPAKDEEVPRGEVSVTGTVKDRTPRANCRVVVNEIRATVETDGSWSVKLPLLSGKQKIDVRAIDEAGNEGSDSRTLFVYREIEGFTFDHPNPQGHPEYHHKESGLEMIYLSGGKFRMGPTEGESRMVKLEPFLISKYEVAQKTWHEVMKTNASTLESDGLPMARVSWGDCQRFCEKVKLELPTEEQWEYACRGGRSGPYGSTGDLDDMGWFTKNSESKIHPVGEKKANDFGIHDMHGNVWEWCRDTYDDDDDDKKVFRGGSWTTGSSECESGYRLGLSKVRQRDDVGFRVVAEID